MIHCVTIDKLGQSLEQLSPVLDSYRRGDPAFPALALHWLETTHKGLSSLRLSELSELGTLGASIIKAGEAIPGPDGLPPRRSQTRARQNIAAAEALERAERVLRDRVQSSEERLRLFEDKLCEGMTAYMLENSLPEGGGEQALRRLWDGLCAYAPTRPLTRYLSASLGSTDRLCLLANILGRL